MNWSSLKVTELKDELKKRGLALSGKKADLVARLESADSEAAAAQEDSAVDDGAAAAAAAQQEAERHAQEAEAARQAEEHQRQKEEAAAVAEAAKKAEEEKAAAEAEKAKKAEADAARKAMEEAEAEAAKKASAEMAAAEAKAVKEASEEKAAAEEKATKQAAEQKAEVEAEAARKAEEQAVAVKKAAGDEKTDEDDGGEASLLDDLVGGDDDDNDEPEAEPTPVKKPKMDQPDTENGGKLSVEVLPRQKPTFKTSKSDANDSEGAGAPAAAEQTCALRIDNFVRPFTESMVRKMLSSYGNLKSMWMPSIKTHCYAVFETTEAAEKCRQGTHGVVWPEGTGRKLTPKFVSEGEAEDAITAGTPRDGAAPRGRGADRGRLFSREETDLRRRASRDGGVVSPRGENVKRPREAAVPLTLDELFKKTNTKPNIYWLPLTKEEVDARKARRAVLKAQKSAGTGDKAEEKIAPVVEDRSAGRKRTPDRSGRRSPEKRRRDDSPPRRRSRDRSPHRRR